MQVRIFSASRLHEALALVRKDLGADAVILDHNEGVDERGNKVWHVHAALDAHPISTPQPRSKQVYSRQIKKEDRADIRNVEVSMQRLERIVEGLGRKETESLRKTMEDKPTQEAFDRLIKLGVAPVYAFDFAHTYANHLPIGGSSLRWANRITPRKTAAVVLLAGPSGAGKTLLAAKLATYYSMRGVRVGLMTSDTTRMGGSETLRAYAGVLGTPFALLRSQIDVPSALASMATAQLMLIDTEGWNPQRLSSCRKQFELWDQLPCTHRILVMPANMDENDGMALLAESDAIQMTELAFTKLDETACPGKIINWAMVSKLGLSYGSYGSDVPGQMGWLTPQSLTALLESQSQRIREAS